jgi:hypothetical protein
MGKTICGFLGVLLCVLAAASSACEAPARPAVPDGGTASEAQMVDGQKAVKAYMAAANDYLACLDEAINDAVRKSEKKELNRSYNRTVDQMNAVAEAFNTALRDFKAAN